MTVKIICSSVYKKSVKVPFKHLIERSRYNRRRKQLNGLTEKVRRVLVNRMVEGETVFLIDSMPIRRTRKRIETVFSQLHDQFRIDRNYAKSFTGFKTRLLAKITALTVSQFINIFHYMRPINHIKHCLI